MPKSSCAGWRNCTAPVCGDEAVLAVHRIGTEPRHPDRPTEVVLPALTLKSTTITFRDDSLVIDRVVAAEVCW